MNSCGSSSTFVYPLTCQFYFDSPLFWLQKTSPLLRRHAASSKPHDFVLWHLIKHNQVAVFSSLCNCLPLFVNTEKNNSNMQRCILTYYKWGRCHFVVCVIVIPPQIKIHHMGILFLAAAVLRRLLLSPSPPYLLSYIQVWWNLNPAISIVFFEEPEVLIKSKFNKVRHIWPFRNNTCKQRWKIQSHL